MCPKSQLGRLFSQESNQEYCSHELNWEYTSYDLNQEYHSYELNATINTVCRQNPLIHATFFPFLPIIAFRKFTSKKTYFIFFKSVVLFISYITIRSILLFGFRAEADKELALKLEQEDRHKKEESIRQ